jgi:hypothetical protein
MTTAIFKWLLEAAPCLDGNTLKIQEYKTTTSMQKKLFQLSKMQTAFCITVNKIFPICITYNELQTMINLTAMHCTVMGTLMPKTPDINGSTRMTSQPHTII